MRLDRFDLRYLLARAKAKAEAQVSDEMLVPIPCRCDPPRQHGPHWVAARRLRKGGDLRGRVKVEPDVLAMVDGR